MCKSHSVPDGPKLVIEEDSEEFWLLVSAFRTWASSESQTADLIFFLNSGRLYQLHLESSFISQHLVMFSISNSGRFVPFNGAST